MGRHPRTWERIRAEKPLDDGLVARWDWLDDALEQVAQARRLRGAGPGQIDAAYERAEIGAVGAADDDVLTELECFVSALGGRIECGSDQCVVAVFGSDEPLNLGRPPCASSI